MCVPPLHYQTPLDELPCQSSSCLVSEVCCSGFFGGILV